MYVKSALTTACVTACTLLLLAATAAAGAELRVTVVQDNGQPFAGAVVVAEPATPAPRGRKALATVDQKNLMFVPDVLVIRTGTDVEFPNSDQVRHQVYSFSGAKKFQLSLYAGRQYAPVNFDKPGLVTLGCNIHDGMIGYIYVTDSPWFGRTDRSGSVALDLPDGSYTLVVQHPRMAEAGGKLQQPLTVNGAAGTTVRLGKPLKSATHLHGGDKSWEDY